MPVHRRRSVRLRLHDYRDGLYFVTVCTHGRRPLFGRVVDGRMVRSWIGAVAHEEWLRTEAVRPDVVLDAFVVMPDHVHLLFGIVPPPDGAVGLGDAGGQGGADDRGGAADPGTAGDRRGVSRYAPAGEASNPDQDPLPRGFRSPSGTAGAVIRGYKGAVTAAINRARGTPGARVWQRSFYDRVVRTDREADAIRRYIHENPARWAFRGDRRDGHRI